jgi:RHS repeat-associated protein
MRADVSRRLGVIASVAAASVALLLLVAGGRADPSPPYYGPAVLATSSVRAYWQFDETSGTTAYDQASSPANGAYQSGVTLGQSGAITTTSGDLAVGFNGSSGYVSVGSVSKLQPSASLTLEAWFKSTSAGGTEPIVQDGTLSGARLLLSGGSLVGVVDGKSIDSASTYNDGAWHYAVLTWDGSMEALYVDGALAAPWNGYANPVSEPTTPSYLSYGLLIGKDTNSNYFAGSIDDVAVYGSGSDSSGALTAGQIANHYEAATSGAVATPVNVVAPTVSGLPQVGSTLTVSSNGSWNASSEIYGALGFSYQWLRCGYDGAGCGAIGGATGSSYLLTSADGGHVVDVRVTASNSGGSSSAMVDLPTVGGYRAAVFSDGGSNLRGYWPLDESYSYPYLRQAADISNSPANGSYQGSGGVTLSQAGAISDGSDLAAKFNGSSGYVSVGSVSKLQPSASLTLEAWFKSTSSGGFEPIVQDGTLSGARLLLSSGKVMGLIDGTSVLSASSYNDGEWHYAVLTWDGSKVALYLDGALAVPWSGYSNPVSEPTAPSYLSYGLLIGEDTNLNYFAGSIDEVALYGSSSDSSGALTPAQVANHFELGAFFRPPAGWTRGSSNDAAPAVCTCAQKASESVNASNGDFSESSADAQAATFGPRLVLARTYDALLAQAQASAGTPGPLGYGWTDNWNMSLSVTSGVVTITQADGAQVTFYPPVSGACQPPYIGSGASGTYCALPEVTASLSYNSGSSTYTFVTHPYASYTFNSSGQLTGESGPGGAALSVAYNTPAPGSGSCPAAAASCAKVTSASGRALVLASNSAGRVTSVIDPLGRTWTYAYCSPPSSTCSANDLVSVTDPLSHVTSFTYDEGNTNASLRHDMLTITHPNGQSGGPNAGAKLVNVYNSSGQVTSQTDPAGNQTSFNYTNLDAVSGSGSTVETDADGTETQYTYRDGVLVSKTVGYGSSSPSTWHYEPDRQTLLGDEVIDPNANATTYVYDARGNLLSTTDPLGNTSTASYNGFDEQTCATLPLAASGCSALSPPAAITGGGTVSPPSAAPPKYVTYSLYDTAGDPIWTTMGDYAPGGSSASQSRTSYRLYSGESVTIGSSNDSCAATPPSTALPCLTIDPNGVVTQLGYNATTGDLTSSSTPDGNTGGEVAETTYSYDGDGELTSAVAPDGNLTGATAANYTTTNTYTNDGQLATSTVSQTGGSITARETQYGYDGDGNRTSVIDPRGKETDYAFTADDQLTLVTDPDSQKTLTCYDGDGNVAETVPPVGVAANSLTAASCPTSYPSGYGDRLASDATTYAYDALGDKTTVTTPAPAGRSGSETTTNAYDAAGRLTSVTAPPASNTSGAPNQVTQYSYDAAGELLTVKKAGSDGSVASTTSYCYDPNGDKTASVPPDGNSSGLASCSSSSPYPTSSSYQTAYSYDSLGELVSKTAPTTSFVTSPTWTYSYDPAGNLLTAEDPNAVTTTNTYTPLNQLATVSYSGSSAHSVTYGYDANGNRLSMVDGTGTSTYGYDVFNELTSYQNGAGKTVSYSYDADGDTTGMTYPLGSPSWASTSTVSYGYDNADELNSVSDFNSNTITVGNTADGLPNSLALGASGDTISTSYDPTDTPSDIKLTNSSSTLQEFNYSDVPSGAISSETDTPSSSLSPADYTYDGQNRVTQMTPGSGSAHNYGFDASGNLTTLPTGATGSYDNASELTSSTLSSTTTSYTYNGDGERTQAAAGGTTTASASYNGAQELTAYNNVGVANMTAATYDGSGLRQTATTGGTTQNFTWDPSGSLPRLLIDSTNAYIYGHGNTPLEQVNLTSGTITYLVSDLLGSVRGVVNTSGTLTAHTSYDAWGNPEGTSLASSTPLGYAGAYTDPSGLNYLINRYYDPSTGQFLTVDPLVDQTGQPYAYSADNPVIEADPDGKGGIPAPHPGLLVGGSALIFITVAADQCVKTGACNSTTQEILKKLLDAVRASTEQTPAIPGTPYSPGEVDKRRSAWRKHFGYLGDPDTLEPIRPGGQSDIADQPSTPEKADHPTGERNVNPREEHSRTPKGAPYFES